MDCPVCLIDKFKLLFTKNNFNIVRCINCGFVYVTPRPSQKELCDFYDKKYFFSQTNYGYKDYKLYETSFIPEAKKRLELIENIVGKGYILDLGCAFGGFLDIAKNQGWRIFGIETSDFAAKIARDRLNILINPNLNAAAFPDNFFDAVTMWEYIEHLLDWREEVKEVYRILKPNGILALTTPNVSGPVASRGLEKWSEMKPPEHLNYFSPETIQMAIKDIGFSVETMEGLANYEHLNTFLSGSKYTKTLIDFNKSSFTILIRNATKPIRYLIEYVFEKYFPISSVKRGCGLFVIAKK